MAQQMRLLKYCDIKSVPNKKNKRTAEYFAAFGNKIESTNNNSTITNCGVSVIDGWNTAYGAVEIKPKANVKYLWAFKIEQHHKKYPSVVIGIQQIEKINLDNRYCDTYFHGQVTLNYGFKSNGKKYSHQIFKSNGVKFSDNFCKEGSLVAMLIDGYSLYFCQLSDEFCERYNIKTIEEYVDCGNWILAEKNISQKGIKYIMAVSLYGKTKLFGSESSDQSSVRLLKYQRMVSKETPIDEESEDESEENDEEHKCDDIDTPKYEFKNKIISLEKQLRDFQNEYDNNGILDWYYKYGQLMQVLSDIESLKVCLRSFTAYIESMENSISSVLEPDVTAYNIWNIPQMIQWIASLDDGAYSKYLDVLEKGFKIDNICCGELLCEITIDSLRSEPFKIKDMMVRKKLVQHFQRLKQLNIPGKQYV